MASAPYTRFPGKPQRRGHNDRAAAANIAARADCAGCRKAEITAVHKPTQPS